MCSYISGQANSGNIFSEFLLRRRFLQIIHSTLSLCESASHGHSSYSMRDSYKDLNLLRYGSISQTQPGPHPSHDPAKTYSRRNFFVIACCVGVSDASRGLFFPTLWLLVETLGGNHADLGTAVALSSAGRILSSPLQGWACETYGYSKILALSNLLTLLGAVVYASATTISSVYWGQFIIGIGAGNLGVCRAYVAEHAELTSRTVQLGYLTAVQFFAFTVLPLIGALLAALGKHHTHTQPPPFPFSAPFLGKLQVDEFSVPALALSVAAALNMLLLRYVFREDDDPEDDFDATARASRSAPAPVSLGGSAAGGMYKYKQVFSTSTPDADIELMREAGPEGSRILPGNRPGRPEVQADTASESGTSTSTEAATATASAVALATVGGCVLNMSAEGAIGVYETISPSVAIDALHWSVSNVGINFAVFGILGVISIMTLPYLTRWFTDIDLMIGGMGLMIVSAVLMSNMTDLTNIHFGFALWLMYSTGYPIGHTAMLGAFSKLTKYGKQGLMMGMFVAAGSAARVWFPVLAGYLTEREQSSVDIFIIVTAQLTACFSVCIYFRLDILQAIGQNDAQRVESE